MIILPINIEIFFLFDALAKAVIYVILKEILNHIEGGPMDFLELNKKTAVIATTTLPTPLQKNS